MGTPDTFEIISFIAASSVCFNCYAVLYNSITREAYLVNISKRGVAIISSAYVSGYEL
jgi:hypothetical protein